MEEITYSEAVLQEYKIGMGSFAEKLPGVARAYHAFTESCFEEGKLGQKDKQLIALAISVHTHNEYCILYHTKGCLDAGSTEEEMMEAIGVAAALGGGSAMSQGVTIWQDALEDFTGTVQ
ncbi:carboxymuconolactone decarboxylase family protein [Sporosarcina sp. E16_3]|uniref:carboxymuconolactone decarboxylase family protein n=1 Tax=Sporosarcina sp. E16_3 TaxID=2789293 RepID=UPI001A9119A4|nr:carboxymuconolactone decarboxylase family protein [Sporosarcina sp. E16_3]MBO0600928.1 carboxymuconolactone decarboxylase family protein [Sporosarcina sp. E16_3]